MTSSEKFVCVDCGCARELHSKHFTPQDRAKASVPKGGYSITLLACDGYRQSKAERKATASQTRGHGDNE